MLCYNNIYRLYSKFIGPPHLGAMIRLMGYQDVAIVIKEMLEVIKNSVSIPTSVIWEYNLLGNNGLFEEKYWNTY